MRPHPDRPSPSSSASPWLARHARIVALLAAGLAAAPQGRAAAQTRTRPAPATLTPAREQGPAPTRGTTQPPAQAQPQAGPTMEAAEPGPGPGAPPAPSVGGTGAAKPLPGTAARPTASGDLPRPPRDPAARREWLRARLDELFGAPYLAKASVSVLVVESESGRPIYARSDKTLLNAASNVKIITSAAGLALLGPEYRWRTTASVVGPAAGAPLPAGGDLPGDLYIRGGGDPTLNSDDLGALVSDLAAAGLHKIRGGVVVDESFFDAAHVGPAYDQKKESYASRAPSSAASLNANVVAVTIVPAAAAGAPARVVVEPASPYFTIAGRVVTAAEGPASPNVETSDETGGRTHIVVSGRVRVGAEPRTFYRRIVSPPLFMGYTLKALLEKRGISVAKPTRVGVSPPQGMRLLASHESAPLGVVVHDLNKRSNNFAAEQIVRTLGAEIVGRPGSWEKGIEAVSRYLTTAGVRRGDYQMTNGSGLYDSNRFSAAQIVTVLRAAMGDFRISAEFMASLAVAGTDGTIAHRMGNTLAERYVRAKTGTLAGTSCLSGFAGSPGNMPLIFSFLMNDLPNPTEARRTQDRAAELLVAYLEAAAGPEPAPVAGREDASGARRSTAAEPSRPR